MPTVDSDGVSIRYTVDGPPDAPAVIALEGLGYGRWMWRFFVSDATPDLRVIRPDNRGTGESDAPEGPYTIAEMAADAAAVIDELGLDQVHVLGASMGGMVAQRLAHEDDRVETLTLLCTSPGGDRATPTPEDVLEHIFSVPPDATDREVIRHRMEPAVSDDFYSQEPDLVESIVDARLESDAEPDARQAQAAAVETFDATHWAADLTMPALVVHGTADRVLPFENGELLAEVLPNATFVPIEDGHHLFFIENRDQVNDRILTFIHEHV